MPILQVAYPSPDVIQQYIDLAKKREYPNLHGSPKGRYIFICTSVGKLVAGVTIYHTDGIYCLFEDFLIADDAPLKLRHAAAMLLGEQIIQHCATNGKIPVCPVTSPGAVRMMRRLGFKGHEVAWMTRDPAPLPLADTEV